MQGCAKFMDTILCPLQCPLHRRHHSCRQDVAPISTIHKHPSSYLLIHWAWDFLSMRDWAVVCWGSFTTTKVPSIAAPSQGHTTNVFQAYARLWADTCAQSIGYLCQPCHPANLLPSHVDAMHEYDNSVALLCYNFLYADSSNPWQPFTPTNNATMMLSETSSTLLPTSHWWQAGPLSILTGHFVP